jgi:CTP-dependent riboflavin kinase
MKSVKHMQSMAGRVTSLDRELSDQIRENEDSNRKNMELVEEKEGLARELADTSQSLEQEKARRQVLEKEVGKLKDILSRAHEAFGNTLQNFQQDE